MDKVVDHLLIFQGEGVVKDFPGNYTQYREWLAMDSKEKLVEKNNVCNVDFVSPKGNNYHHDARKRLSYNEKREFEQLGKDLVLLEEEKKEIEEKFSNGMLSIDEITKLSKRLPEVKSAIDEKETRWLELSEYEA